MINVSIGASDDVTTVLDEEPMWMQTTVPSSSQVAQNGSQWSVWKLGRPIFSGDSVKVTAWQPFAARRRVSAAIRSGSHTGTTPSGIIRPG